MIGNSTVITGISNCPEMASLNVHIQPVIAVLPRVSIQKLK